MPQDFDRAKSLSIVSQAVEPLVAAIIQLLSTVPDYGPALSSIGTGGFLAWQNQNLDRAIQQIRSELAHREESKIDRNFLQKDEFKDIAIQVVEELLKTSSELRCDASVKVFCASFTKPTSAYVNKRGLIRLASQMSDEEVLALYVIRDEERKFFSGTEQGERTTPDVEVATIASQLSWEPINALVACQGLQQLNVVYNVEINGGVYSSGGQYYTSGDSLPGDRVFRSTELGHRLILFAHGGTWSY